MSKPDDTDSSTSATHAYEAAPNRPDAESTKIKALLSTGIQTFGRYSSLSTVAASPLIYHSTLFDPMVNARSRVTVSDRS